MIALIPTHKRRCFLTGATDALAVDHVHSTKTPKLRGLLHNSVNLSLGFLTRSLDKHEDSMPTLDTLKAFAEYAYRPTYRLANYIRAFNQLNPHALRICGREIQSYLY